VSQPVPQPRKETKELMLSVPLEPSYDGVIKTRARQEARSVSGYIRWLILEDLKAKGLLNEDLEPVTEDTEAAS